MSPVFIDFEAFQHGTEHYKIKELCIMDTARPSKPLHLVFTPHIQWHRLKEQQRRTYAYQSNHLHQLLWQEGCVRYCPNCILFTIQLHFHNWRNITFNVLGSQKLEFLQWQFPQLRFVQYNATLSQLPQLCPQSHCPYRNHGPHCAVLKCYKLYYHYMMLS